MSNDLLQCGKPIAVWCVSRCACFVMTFMLGFVQAADANEEGDLCLAAPAVEDDAARMKSGMMNPGSRLGTVERIGDGDVRRDGRDIVFSLPPIGFTLVEVDV